MKQQQKPQPQQPLTLLVSGTLSARAVGKHLRSHAAKHTVVLELDTVLCRNPFPAVHAWLDSSPLNGEEVAITNQEIDQLLNYFLDNDIDCPSRTIPTHRAFRAAALSVDVRRLIAPYLINYKIGLKALQSGIGNFGHIIVAAGCGTSFAAWNDLAQQFQLPITFLPIQKDLWFYKRRLIKAWYRWRASSAKKNGGDKARAKSSPASAPAPLATSHPTSGITSTSAHHAQPPGSILCTSSRVARLLDSDYFHQTASLKLPIIKLTATQQGSFNSAQVEKKARYYADWWRTWQQQYLNTEAYIGGIPNATHIIREVGSYLVKNIYPEYACLYAHAQDTLKSIQPQMVLCDTQLGTKERMWSLAAQEQEIPVVGYVYDFVPDPNFSFRPDYVLSDSEWATTLSIRQGIAPEIIIPVQSHRQHQTQAQGASAKTAKGSATTLAGAHTDKPLIVFADSYYPGTNANSDPRFFYHIYELVAEAARQLPDYQFGIKFHPLRGKKQADLAFTSFDDLEMAARKRYIDSLNPPSNLRCIEPEVSLASLLPRAAVLLNLNSTAALEAYEIGVPVVFVQEPVSRFTLNPEYNPCIYAPTVDSLVNSLHRLITDSNVRGTHIQNQIQFLTKAYWLAQMSLPEGIHHCYRDLIQSANNNKPSC